MKKPAGVRRLAFLVQAAVHVGCLALPKNVVYRDSPDRRALMHPAATLPPTGPDLF